MSCSMSTVNFAAATINPSQLSFFRRSLAHPTNLTHRLLSSNNVDQHIKLLSVSQSNLSAFLAPVSSFCASDSSTRALSNLVGAASVVPLATAGPDH